MTYEDGNGDLQTIQEIWDVDYVSIDAVQIVSASGVTEITCTTTTTTTV